MDKLTKIQNYGKVEKYINVLIYIYQIELSKEREIMGHQNHGIDST